VGRKAEKVGTFCAENQFVLGEVRREKAPEMPKQKPKEEEL
jgi:hypothetical protein